MTYESSVRLLMGKTITLGVGPPEARLMPYISNYKYHTYAFITPGRLYIAFCTRMRTDTSNRHTYIKYQRTTHSDHAQIRPCLVLWRETPHSFLLITDAKNCFRVYFGCFGCFGRCVFRTAPVLGAVFQIFSVSEFSFGIRVFH